MGMCPFPHGGLVGIDECRPGPSSLGSGLGLQGSASAPLPTAEQCHMADPPKTDEVKLETEAVAATRWPPVGRSALRRRFRFTITRDNQGHRGFYLPFAPNQQPFSDLLAMYLLPSYCRRWGICRWLYLQANFGSSGTSVWAIGRGLCTNAAFTPDTEWGLRAIAPPWHLRSSMRSVPDRSIS